MTEQHFKLYLKSRRKKEFISLERLPIQDTKSPSTANLF